MLKLVYGTFGLTYKMALSTRPEEKLGDDAMWDQAEGALRSALDDTGLEWEVGIPDLAVADWPIQDDTQHDQMLLIASFNVPNI